MTTLWAAVPKSADNIIEEEVLEFCQNSNEQESKHSVALWRSDPDLWKEIDRTPAGESINLSRRALIISERYPKFSWKACLLLAEFYEPRKSHWTERFGQCTTIWCPAEAGYRPEYQQVIVEDLDDDVVNVGMVPRVPEIPKLTRSQAVFIPPVKPVNSSLLDRFVLTFFFPQCKLEKGFGKYDVMFIVVFILLFYFGDYWSFFAPMWLFFYGMWNFFNRFIKDEAYVFICNFFMMVYLPFFSLAPLYSNCTTLFDVLLSMGLVGPIVEEIVKGSLVSCFTFGVYEYLIYALQDGFSVRRLFPMFMHFVTGFTPSITERLLIHIVWNVCAVMLSHYGVTGDTCFPTMCGSLSAVVVPYKPVWLDTWNSLSSRMNPREVEWLISSLVILKKYEPRFVNILLIKGSKARSNKLKHDLHVFFIHYFEQFKNHFRNSFKPARYESSGLDVESIIDFVQLGKICKDICFGDSFDKLSATMLMCLKFEKSDIGKVFFGDLTNFFLGCDFESLVSGEKQPDFQYEGASEDATNLVNLVGSKLAPELNQGVLMKKVLSVLACCLSETFLKGIPVNVKFYVDMIANAVSKTSVWMNPLVAVVDLVTHIVKGVRDYMTSGSWDSLFYGNVEVRWARDVVELCCSDALINEEAVPPPGTMTRDQRIEKCTKLIAMSKSLKRHDLTLQQVNNYVYDLHNLLALDNCIKAGSHMRREPLGLFIYGPPGTGKSNMTSDFCQIVCGVEGLKYGDYSMYTRNTAQKHWDGHIDMKTPCVLYNDIPKDGYLDSNENAAPLEFQRIIDNTPFPTPRADLAGKKENLIAPNLVVVTSNHSIFNFSPFGTDHSRLNRRFSFNFSVFQNSEYIKKCLAKKGLEVYNPEKPYKGLTPEECEQAMIFTELQTDSTQANGIWGFKEKPNGKIFFRKQDLLNYFQAFYVEHKKSTEAWIATKKDVVKCRFNRVAFAHLDPLQMTYRKCCEECDATMSTFYGKVAVEAFADWLAVPDDKYKEFQEFPLAYDLGDCLHFPKNVNGVFSWARISRLTGLDEDGRDYNVLIFKIFCRNLDVSGDIIDAMSCYAASHKEFRESEFFQSQGVSLKRRTLRPEAAVELDIDEKRILLFIFFLSLIYFGFLQTVFVCVLIYFFSQKYPLIFYPKFYDVLFTLTESSYNIAESLNLSKLSTNLLFLKTSCVNHMRRDYYERKAKEWLPLLVGSLAVLMVARSQAQKWSWFEGSVVSIHPSKRVIPPSVEGFPITVDKIVSDQSLSGLPDQKREWQKADYSLLRVSKNLQNTTLSDLERSCLLKTFPVMVTGSVTRKAFGFFVDHSIFIVPKHLFVSFESNYVSIGIENSLTWHYNVMLRKEDMFISKKDFVAFRVAGSPVTSKLVDHLTPHDYVGYNGKAIIAGNDEDFIVKYTTVPIENSPEPISGLGYSSVNLKEGCCGRLLLADIQGKSCVLGFHSAGQDNFKVSTLFSQVDFFDIIAHFRDNKILVKPEAVPFYLDVSPLPENLGPVHPNSRLGMATFSGYAFGSVNMKNSPSPSRLVPTLVCDVFKPILDNYKLMGVPPLEMKGGLVNGVWLSPAVHTFNGLSAKGVSIPYYEKMAVEDYLAKMPMLTEKIYPLTVETAFNGFPKKVDSIPWATSIGPRLRSAGYTSKADLFTSCGDDKFEISSEFLALVFRQLEILKSRPISLRSVYNRKDEIISEKKISEFNFRLFNVFDLEINIIFKMFLGPILSHMLSLPEFFECYGKMNAASSDWTRLRAHIIRFKNIFAGDQEKFDKRHKSHMFRNCAEIFYRIALAWGYSDQHATIVFNLIYSLCYNLIEFDADYFLSFGGLGSGIFVTLIINSMIHSLLFRMAFYYCKTKNGDALVPFRSEVAVAFVGDDNVGGTSYEKFNQHFIRDAMVQFGYVYTSPTKDRPLELWDSMESATFLKRRFVYDEQVGRCYAPIEKASIYKPFCWQMEDSGISEGERLYGVAGNAQREAFLHGKDFFEEIKVLIIKEFDEKNLTYPLFSWEDLLVEYNGDTFTTWDC